MRNKYWCPKCDKPFPPENFCIQVGDRVDYTVQQVCDDNDECFIRFSSEEGDVLKIEGKNAFIACEDGDEEWFPIDSLTLSAAPNSLTMAFTGICECQKEEGQ